VDPIAFLYNTNDPETILYNATSSSLRNVIGSSTVDDALTDGRTKIINDIRENLVELSNNYKLGISIINVNLQDVDLPTSEVDAAFKSVTDAREERITKINEATKYRNEKINQVEGEQAAILSRAEGEKISTIEKAKGDVAKFNAIYSEYKINPEITRYRLTIQALELAFKDAKLVIVDDNGETVRYLPIDNFMKKGAN
jgi:membrane protease subunit HflK